MSHVASPPLPISFSLRAEVPCLRARACAHAVGSPVCPSAEASSSPNRTRHSSLGAACRPTACAGMAELGWAESRPADVHCATIPMSGETAGPVAESGFRMQPLACFGNFRVGRQHRMMAGRASESRIRATWSDARGEQPGRNLSTHCRDSPAGRPGFIAQQLAAQAPAVPVAPLMPNEI